MRLGLISDTHGLLRREALEALAGCGLIIHAGDVGSAEILERLNAVAQVRHGTVEISANPFGISSCHC